MADWLVGFVGHAAYVGELSILRVEIHHPLGEILRHHQAPLPVLSFTTKDEHNALVPKQVVLTRIANKLSLQDVMAHQKASLTYRS
jgi:hypothetical protein